MAQDNKECEDESCDRESCEGCPQAAGGGIPKAEALPSTHIKRVIGVVSGKGGVGKSLVTSLLAAQLARDGKKVGILDADVTGPSIPKMMGIARRFEPTEGGIKPAESEGGIKIMSVNLLLPEDTDPVIWRGPVVSGVVKQFWSDMIWGDLDVLLVDMPPGTGDVALTVFQSLPVDGIVIVASPQALVEMIATKAIKMASEMDVPSIALVENMSYLECPHCGEKIDVFGKSGLDSLAEKYGIPNYVRMAIHPEFAVASDEGKLASVDAPELKPLAEALEKMVG